MLFKAVLECCVSGLVSIMAGGSLPSGRDRAGVSKLSLRFGASTLQHVATHVRSGYYAQQGQFITRSYSESNDMSSSDHLATDLLFFFTMFVPSPLQFGKHFMQFYLEVCLKVLRKDKSYLEEARALRKQVLTTLSRYMEIKK